MGSARLHGIAGISGGVPRFPPTADVALIITDNGVGITFQQLADPALHGGILKNEVGRVTHGTWHLVAIFRDEYKIQRPEVYDYE